MPYAARLWPLLGLFTLSVAGCFTEVGNAEDERLVQTKFQIDYGPGSGPQPKMATGIPDSTKVAILQFYASIQEAEFDLLDSASNRRQEFHLWSDDTAALDVDFTGTDSAAVLPEQKVGVLNPHDFHLHCLLRVHHPLNPDTVDFPGFRDRSYIKGIFTAGKDSTPFLFALPNTGAYELTYMADVISGWYANGIYHCRFIFYANKWVSGLKLSGAAVSKDKNGDRIMVLDPEHNGSLHDSLEARFYKAFNAYRVNYSPDP